MSRPLNSKDRQVTFSIKMAINRLKTVKNLSKNGRQIKISSGLLEHLRSSQLEGAEFESDIGI